MRINKVAKMPTLALINFNIVCATLGGFISLFGLVSYLCKEQFYLSEACKNISNSTRKKYELTEM